MTLGVILVGWMLFAQIQTSGVRQNYLFKGSVDLRNHVISDGVPLGKRAIVMLGSSTVSGNNIPPATTISDYYNRLVPRDKSYNLGVMEASVVDSLIWLNLAQKKVRPAIVFYGMNPSDFRTDPGSPLIWSHSQEVRTLLPENIARSVERDRWNKRDLSVPVTQLFGKPPLTSVQTSIFTWQWKLRRWTYGPLYDKAIDSLERRDGTVEAVADSDGQMMDLVACMKALAAQTHGELIAYLEPMQVPDGPGTAFDRYKNTLTSKLSATHVRFLDFGHLLPNTAEYFVDYIHLTPEGNKRVAEELAKASGGID